MTRKMTWSGSEKLHALRMGDKIAAARIALGMTQDALARELGISQGRVARVEIGATDLSRKAIAEAVGVYDSDAPTDAHDIAGAA